MLSEYQGICQVNVKEEAEWKSKVWMKKQIVLRQSLCVTATKAGAASPLPTLELSLSISCYKTHLSFHLFCFWTWFFDSGFKIDCTLYNISSWFKGMLMLENFCHIITLLTSSSVILCWFWSLQITGKRTNNLLVIKLFNCAWLSAAPGSCWCCQLIFLLNPADLKCKPVLRWEPSWQPLLISCSADSVRGRCLACLRQRPTENLLLSTHPALGDLSRHAHQAKEKMCVWSSGSIL